MNELKKLVAAHREKLAKIQARQTECLVSAEKDECSADDRNTFLKEFDALEADKRMVSDQLARTEELIRAYLEPAQQTLVLGPAPSEYQTRTIRMDIPANVRRVNASQLQAFTGPNAEYEAYRAGIWVLGAMFGNSSALARFNELGLRLQPNDGTFAATLNTGNNQYGGYFVPDPIDYAIFRLTEMYGVFRRDAARVNMTSDTWRGPRWTNAIVLTWVAEGSAPGQTEPGHDMIEVVARNLAGYGKMTVNVNEDAAISLGDEWSAAAGIANAKAEDDAGFNGDGSNTYGGIVGLLPLVRLAGNAASVVTAATGHDTVPELTLADFDSVLGAYPNYEAGVASPKWYMHKTVFYASMAPLQHAAGGALPRDIAGAPILGQGGYPVEFVNVMPRLSAFTASFIGILFGDLKLSSKIGDRRGRIMEVGRINDDMIKQLLTLFTASRVGITNHTIVDPLNSALPGPIIGLKTAA